MEEKTETAEVSNADDLVWHYTDTEGFRNIFAQETIRATDYRYLNDPLEGEVAKRVLDSILEEASSTKTVVRNSILLLRVQANVARSEDYAQAVKALFPDRGPYVVSLSEHGDLLSQWRAYAKSSGYSIAFGKEDLANFANSYAGVFQKVRYLSRMDDPTVTKFFVTSRESSEITVRQNLEDLCACKMDGHSEECEWRLVFSSDEKEWYRPQAIEKKYSGKVFPIPKLEFRDGMIGLTPFITLPRHPDDGASLPIRHVIVGPGPNAGLRKLAAEQMLAGKNVKVTLSRTELRS